MNELTIQGSPTGAPLQTMQLSAIKNNWSHAIQDSNKDWSVEYIEWQAAGKVAEFKIKSKQKYNKF